MSHVVHPYAHRLIILRDWKSRWFAVKGEYRKNLKGDVLIREFLEKRLRGMYVSSIEMERDAKSTRLIIRTSRPGMVIGRSGEGALKIKADVIKKMQKLGVEMNKDFKLDIIEVSEPDADASIIAQSAAEMLEKRMTFRRVMKTITDKVMNVKGVKGCRIVLSGRLGGSEMARREDLKKGSIPLQFIRADIDFCKYEAKLPYGVIGVKVWIHKGDSLEVADTAQKFPNSNK